MQRTRGTQGGEIQDSGADPSWSVELESLRARLKLRVFIATGDGAG